MRKSLEILACAAFLISGCSKAPISLNQGSVEKGEPALKKLMSRTDIVLVRHFYTKSSESEDRDPKYSEIYPGGVSIVPVWAYEPGKQKDGQRGAQIIVVESWLPSSAGGTSRPQSATAFLDLDELKDLDSALSYFAQSDSPWHSSTSADSVEAHFGSKDDFAVTAFKTDDGKELLALEAGSSAVRLPIAKLSAFKSDIDTAISLLESKS